MRTKTEVWLMIAAALVLFGAILFSGVMIKLKWDFNALSTVHYETNIHEIDEAFDSISIHTDTADIAFALSGDGKCRVECHEEAKAEHSVTVENGALTIERIAVRYIGLNFDTPKITVYLPKEEYASLHVEESTGDIDVPKEISFKNVDLSLSTGDVDFAASVADTLKIKTSTGDICVEDLSVGVLYLSVSTGKVTVTDVVCEGTITVGVTTGKAKLTGITCKSVTSKGSTGDIVFENVVAAELFSVERGTGDVTFDGADAAEIFVKTDTGDVTGSFLTDKIFITKTDTGDVDVPKTTNGGKCEIYTDTGDINISVSR